MTRSPTAKLALLAGLSALGLCAGVVAGRPDLVAAAVPLLTAIALGLSLTRAPSVSVTVDAAPPRCLEGDAVEVGVTLLAEHSADVDVAVALPCGLEPVDDAIFSVRVARGEAEHVRVRLAARRWGVYEIGAGALRVGAPGGLVVFERALRPGRAVRVYPAAEPMRTEIAPPETQVYTGNYVSRAAGDGIEFAAVRPFVPTDTRRRVNWRVTSRRGELHVNEFHPERNADVVLFLDTFVEVGEPPHTSLDRTVRGAAALSRHYLARKNRVGLVAFGGVLGWVRVASGLQSLHRIADYLIALEATPSYARKDIAYLPRRSLPQLALVIAFSPLVDERALDAFGDLRARGFALVVIDTLPEASVRPGSAPEEEVAYRAWRLARAARRSELQDAGVPVVPWADEEPLAAAAARLPPLARMPRATRA